MCTSGTARIRTISAARVPRENTPGDALIGEAKTHVSNVTRRRWPLGYGVLILLITAAVIGGVIPANQRSGAPKEPRCKAVFKESRIGNLSCGSAVFVCVREVNNGYGEP